MRIDDFDIQLKNLIKIENAILLPTREFSLFKEYYSYRKSHIETMF